MDETSRLIKMENWGYFANLNGIHITSYTINLVFYLSYVIAFVFNLTFLFKDFFPESYIVLAITSLELIMASIVRTGFIKSRPVIICIAWIPHLIFGSTKFIFSLLIFIRSSGALVHLAMLTFNFPIIPFILIEFIIYTHFRNKYGTLE